MSDARRGRDGSDTGGVLVPAVARAAAIMDVLAERDGVPVSVSDLSRVLRLPRSSTANLCATLADTGLGQDLTRDDLLHELFALRKGMISPMEPHAG